MAVKMRQRIAHYPDCPWVFHRNGKRIPDYYYGYWYRACREAGLIGKIPLSTGYRQDVLTKSSR